jgi:uncharacterized membrane protein
VRTGGWHSLPCRSGKLISRNRLLPSEAVKANPLALERRANLRIHLWIGILLIAITLLVTAVLYPRLPSSIPMHWNAHDYADASSPRGTLAVES